MKPILVGPVASSDIYRFIVGPDKKAYYVHSAVITQHWPTLDAVVSEALRDSAEQTVDWTDVDPTAFLSLWQFLYSGGYRVLFRGSKTDEDLLKYEIREEEEEEEEEELCPLKKPMSNVIWFNFNGLSLADPEHPPSRQPRFVGSRVVVDSEADILLHHARVCVLADKYVIPPLKQLALAALRDALTTYLWCLESIEKWAPEVIALSHYCFNNPTPEKLRKLVSLFTACIIRDLWYIKEFQDLLESSGELSKGILGHIIPNLAEIDEIRGASTPRKERGDVPKIVSGRARNLCTLL